jgi:hypothetical protein
VAKASRYQKRQQCKNGNTKETKSLTENNFSRHGSRIAKSFNAKFFKT